MGRGRSVPHFDYVDLQNISSSFFQDRSHRAYLKIPLLGDRGPKTLCVIGQNPSAADEREADKTIRYLEELVFRRLEGYCQIVVLNLFSQVDTRKTQGGPPLHPECARVFNGIVADEVDFLVVFGKLKNHGQYKFKDRALEIEPLLRSKHVFKLDVGTPFAPHPGNPKITYCNYGLGFAPYTFSDLC